MLYGAKSDAVSAVEDMKIKDSREDELSVAGLFCFIEGDPPHVSFDRVCACGSSEPYFCPGRFAGLMPGCFVGWDGAPCEFMRMKENPGCDLYTVGILFDRQGGFAEEAVRKTETCRLLSGYRPFPDGFVAAVVRNGQLERIAPALRGAGVVEGVGDGSLHRIAFEQDPFPVERGRIAAYAGEVVPQAEGDAACFDRLFGFEAGLDLWRNGVGHHAEVAQCPGREGDGAVFIFSSGVRDLPFADESQGGVGL